MSSLSAMIGRKMRHVGEGYECLGTPMIGALGIVEVWDTVGPVYSAPYPEAAAPLHVIDVRVERLAAGDLAGGIRRVLVADLDVEVS